MVAEETATALIVHYSILFTALGNIDLHPTCLPIFYRSH